MTGFLDRLLHADKPQPLDVDTAAARRVRPVAGRALGRSGRKETAPVQGERDRGSCASAGPVDPGMRVDDRAA